jgi:hypothetical protein
LFSYVTLGDVLVCELGILKVVEFNSRGRVEQYSLGEVGPDTSSVALNVRSYLLDVLCKLVGLLAIFSSWHVVGSLKGHAGHHSHLVLGQSTCFVGTNVRGSTHGF